ncbi:MAG: hypothetical protein Q8P97_00295 [bacterium]|nr:hypothetical protein [bacterium]
MLTFIAIISLFTGFNPAIAASPSLSDQGNIEVAQPTDYETGALVAPGGPLNSSYFKLAVRPRAVYTKEVSAFSSTPEETDETPFITASGTYVRQGIVAANWLPFGTKIRIPAISETAVFTVEDRMHSRYSDRVDVWFPEKIQAKDFGVRTLVIEVL